MKLIAQILFIIVSGTNIAFAQSSSEFSTSKSYPPKSNSLPNRNSHDTYKDDHGAVIDVNGYQKSEAEQKKLIESLGYEFVPMRNSEKNSVGDYFTMPPNEMLSGCTYAATFSYPEMCNDNKGKIIFKVCLPLKGLRT